MTMTELSLKHRWPIAIAVLGIAFVLLTAWSVYKASTQVSSPVMRHDQSTAKAPDGSL
jgi:hypothetical protein